MPSFRSTHCITNRGGVCFPPCMVRFMQLKCSMWWAQGRFVLTTRLVTIVMQFACVIDHKYRRCQLPKTPLDLLYKNPRFEMRRARTLSKKESKLARATALACSSLDLCMASRTSGSSGYDLKACGPALESLRMTKIFSFSFR